MPDVETQKQEKTTFEASIEELPQIMTGIDTREENKIIQVRATYLPTQKHSEAFCYITHDTNPIHSKIAPILLQFSALNLLARKTMEKSGISYLDYPFVQVDTDGKSLIINNCPYQLDMRIDPRCTPIRVSAAITNPRINNHPVYTLNLEAHKEEPEGFAPEIDLSKFSHACAFKGTEAKAFSHLIGGESVERTLYSIAVSSSVVFDAVKQGRLNMENGLMAVYDSQRVYFNSQTGPNMADGILLELFLSEREKFGKSTRRDETLDMKILARNSEGKPIYLSHAPVKFPREELLETKLEMERRRLERALRMSAG